MEIEKPNFLIIGSAKCGTTALASILDGHPDCCMSRPKETSFFQDIMDFEVNPNYEKGWEWLQRAFKHYSGEPVIGESTPSNSDRFRSPKTANRIFEFNPKMKIIYMVRDPLARQISAWKMQWAHGKQNLHPWRREDQWALQGFNFWMMKQRDSGQWTECKYGYQLEAYSDCFPKSQIMVSAIEKWKEDHDTEVGQILEFLNLDPDRLDSLQPKFANIANDRRQEIAGLGSLRRTSLIRMMVQRLPSTWRNQWRHHLDRFTSKKLTPPQADISAELKDEFLKYIKADLKYQDSPLREFANYWPSLDSEADPT
jgi:hypothetical protein